MKLKPLILCALFAALTIAGSFVKIPIPGTPLLFTLQTFFVFLSGLLLDARYAFVSQFVYMAVGLLGLPVFSMGGGFSYVLSPSFGFILGFCACAPLVSLLVRKPLYEWTNTQKSRKILMLRIAAGALSSIAALYVFGIIYMYLIYHLYLNETVTLGYVIVSSTGIFFILDTAKMALAIPLGAAVIRRLPKNR